MCWFCDCEHSRHWRDRVEQKIDIILRSVIGSTHLSNHDREAIQLATLKLQKSTESANAAIAANNPSKLKGSKKKGETP